MYHSVYQSQVTVILKHNVIDALSKDVIVPAEKRSGVRLLPHGLRSVDTRNNNPDQIISNFNNEIAARFNLPSIEPQNNKKEYCVRYDTFLEKLQSLIDMFEFFKNFNKYTEMVSKMKKIISQCSTVIKKKYAMYNHINKVNDNIDLWQKQAQSIKANFDELNQDTLESEGATQYLDDLRTVFIDGTKTLINKLPIQRVTRELELSYGFISVCRKLMEPLLQSANVQCPVCLEGNSGNIYALQCGHVICGNCVTHVNQCPVCRQSFNHQSAIKLYFSEDSEVAGTGAEIGAGTGWTLQWSNNADV